MDGLVLKCVLVVTTIAAISNAAGIQAINYPYNLQVPYAIGYSYGRPSYISPYTYPWDIKHHHPDHKEDTSSEGNKMDTKPHNPLEMPVTTSELNRYIFSHPIVHAIPTPLSRTNSIQYHIQDRFGQYFYGYANPQSSKQEQKTVDGITQGSYSYIDSNGKLQTVKYIADQDGFRVAATNLPRAPVPVEIPDSPELMLAKKQHFQAQKEALDRLNVANNINDY